MLSSTWDMATFFLQCPHVSPVSRHCGQLRNLSHSNRCRRPRSCAALNKNSGHIIPNSAPTPNLTPASSFPAYIPQTIEWAVARAQEALANALVDDVRRLIIELPMGRSRKYWYQLAPRDSWIRESGVLASHIAHAVQEADVRVVLGDNCGSDSCVNPWITRRHILRSAIQEDFLGETEESTILFVVGVPKKHASLLYDLMKKVPANVPVVLFNCLMDAPLGSKSYPPGFIPTYMCRALKRCAFARYGHRAPYSLYVEIAVFEYEWVADVADNQHFIPSQEAIERAAFLRGAHSVGGQGFYKSPHRGCEAGFWPFMSLAAKYILPLQGDSYRKESDCTRKRKPSTSSKPFGFF